jgi:RNA polymerase sigma-70 factor (ECF subfamily)
MSDETTARTATDDDAALAAIRAGDEAAFGALVERYRRQLHVHCYRMVGSFDDAEDLVQETLLRAWRARDSFEGRSMFRTWLYRIATNACINMIERGPRRILRPDVPPTDPRKVLQADARPDLGAPPAELAWIQPYPDHLLDLAAPSESEPDAIAVSRETIELAYLVAIQYLPPKQRAILILRDVLDWSARETASLLELSVASVNSGLQRARSTLRSHTPAQRSRAASVTSLTAEDRVLLDRFVDAHNRADAAALSAILREDARQSMPPHLLWYDGREALVTLFGSYVYPSSPHYPGQLRFVATAANRQPAATTYLRRTGDSEYRLLGLNVLEIDDGLVTGITSFGTDLLGTLGISQTL